MQPIMAFIDGTFKIIQILLHHIKNRWFILGVFLVEKIDSKFDWVFGPLYVPPPQCSLPPLVVLAVLVKLAGANFTGGGGG